MRAAGVRALSGLVLLLLLVAGRVPQRTWAASRSVKKHSRHKASHKWKSKKPVFLPTIMDFRKPIDPDSGESSTSSFGNRKLFIHIGPHKTGTTFFQTWMWALRGISDTLIYPKMCGHYVEHVWFAQLADGICGSGKNWASAPACEPTTQNLIESIDQLPAGKDAVISSEAFSKCTSDGFDKLNAALNQTFDIYVIGVRRDSRALFLSRFHEVHKDFEKPDRLWDAVIHGDHLSKLCSYMSVACINRLAEVFGQDRVVTISYEGMQAADKELAEVLCEEFSTADCLKPEELVTLKTNNSPTHLTYSALALYNQLRLLLGCDDDFLFASLTQTSIKYKAQYNADAPVADVAEVRQALQVWLEALEEAGVRQNCLPMSVVQPNARRVYESDTAFHRLIRKGKLPGRHLYFAEGEALKTLPQFCEFDESAVWENLEILERLSNVVRSIASCDQD